MKLTPVAFDSKLAAYQKQAEELLAAWRSWDEEAVQIIRQHHPPFLDEKVPWLTKKLTEDELRCAPFDLPDAQLALARWYRFADWQAVERYVAKVGQTDSSVWRFEAAVEAVINGDANALAGLLRKDPELVRAR